MSINRGVTLTAAAMVLAVAQASSLAALTYSSTPVIVSGPESAYSTVRISGVAGNASGTVLVGYELGTSASSSARTTWYKAADGSLTAFSGLDASGAAADGFLNNTINAYSSGGTYVAGYLSTYYGTTTSYGLLPWVANVATGQATVIGIPAAGVGGYQYYYEKTVSYNGSNVTGKVTSLYSSFVSDNGAVIGSATRYYNSTGGSLGTDVFYYNPTTGVTSIINLTGSVSDGVSSYEGLGFTSGAAPGVYHSSVAKGINANGVAIGTSARYLSTSSTSTTGNDAWMYDPTTATTTRIGLVGDVYSPVAGGPTFANSSVTAINSSGSILGTSAVYASTTSSATYGNVAWIYNPTGTPGTATGFGTSSAGTYTQVGLITDPSGAGYSYTSSNNVQNQTVTHLNNSGIAVGYTTRYLPASTSPRGSDVWYFNGTQTRRINLASASDTTHVSSNGSMTATTTQLTNSGWVAGSITRYVTGSVISIGSDAWIYNTAWAGTDSSTGEAIDNGVIISAPSTVNTDGLYSEVAITQISDQGVALGYYAYSSSQYVTSNFQAAYMFYWTEDTGLVTLNQLVGATSSNYKTLAGYYKLGLDGNIYFTDSTGSTLYAYVAEVPEPASISLIALGAVMLLSRRGKRSA